MLDNSSFGLIRISRIDPYKVRPEGWLQQRRENRVRHDDHVPAKDHRGV